MEQPAQDGTQSIDITGLSAEAVRAVEAHVAALREQAGPRAYYRTHEEWSRAFHEWVNSHPKRDTLADWSRESIYDGCGE
jgi:hypothetical protein